MSALVHIPPLELAKLWGELIEAEHGLHMFGGDTAEIYAYRFGQQSPVAEHGASSGLLESLRTMRAARAGRALVELCELFADWRECILRIDGLRVEDWRDQFVCGFDHRVQVQVSRRPEPEEDEGTWTLIVTRTVGQAYGQRETFTFTGLTWTEVEEKIGEEEQDAAQHGERISFAYEEETE